MLLLLPASWVAAAPCGTSVADSEPPLVFVLPPERAFSPEGFILRARIEDASGADSVTLWAKRDGDDAYRAVTMERSSGGEFEARLPGRTGKERWLAYYVEATDLEGNGPGRNGSPESPFVIDHDRPLAKAQMASGTKVILIATLIAAPFMLILLFVFILPERRRRDQEFWLELLAPVSKEEGTELEEAIEAICAICHWHPNRGEIRLDRDEAFARLASLKEKDPERLEEARIDHLSIARDVSSAMALPHASPEQVVEELFWFELLGELVDLPRERVERALEELAAQALIHPTDGERRYELPTLRAKLDGVRRINPSELYAQASALGIEQPVRPKADEPPALGTGKSAGLSLVELLVVLVVLGLVVGMGALYLKPAEAPLKTGGQQVDGLLRQARSKAMSSTTAHRIRPISPEQLVVEYAPSCSSDAWTLDPRMDLGLPRGVSLTETSWSLCFSSRGLASQNMILTLQHEGDSRQLEVLLGGTVRWL